MSPPRILLIGRIGQVGWELRRTLAPLGHLVCVDYPEIDLTDGRSIARWVNEAKPQVIINAAAYTAVDKAEAEPDLALKINGTAPGLLAEQARQRQALLIHYSTDYVFDGTKTSPYAEDDVPNPQSAYGRSKLAGDRAIQQVDCAHLVFRLCWVYGGRGQNFMLTMMRLAREREKLRVVCDQVGCPTWSRIIAETTTLALQRVWASGDFAPWKGVYHLAAAGQTSWHGFAERIVSQVPESERRCQVVEAITTPEYPTPARRPAYSALGCDKLERTFGLRPPDWEEQLRLVAGT